MAKTVADMPTGELRDMIEDLIEEKLVQASRLAKRPRGDLFAWTHVIDELSIYR